MEEMKIAGALEVAIALRNTPILTQPSKYAVSQQAHTSWYVKISTETDGMEDTSKSVE